MLGGEHHVTRSDPMEQPGPDGWVPVFDTPVEHRHEVVVVEVLAVGLQVVLRGGRAGDAQAVQVPLGVGILREPAGCGQLAVLSAGGGPGGHRIETPVDEDAELGAREPFGNPMGAQRIPVGFITAQPVRQEIAANRAGDHSQEPAMECSSVHSDPSSMER